MTELITFIVPTRNLQHLSEQFDHFEKTTHDYNNIAFLVKIDADHSGAEAFLKEQILSRPFKINYVSTPRIEGTFSLWMAVDQLFGLVEPESYFVQILSDEPYFITQGWDLILKRYIGFYPDHLFRLRLSDVKFNNYASNYECAFRCDSFPIYTRRWLELSEGTGDCWGSDAYQQLVSFHLFLGPGGYANFYRIESICRDVPITDLVMGNLDFGVGVSSEMQVERHFRNLKEWNRLSSYRMQLHFSYLARRMQAYIWAKEHRIDHFKIIKDAKLYRVVVINQQNQTIYERSYKLQKWLIFLQNFHRNVVTLYWLKSSRKWSPLVPHLYRLKNHRFRRFRCSIEQLTAHIKQIPNKLSSSIHRGCLRVTDGLTQLKDSIPFVKKLNVDNIRIMSFITEVISFLSIMLYELVSVVSIFIYAVIKRFLKSSFKIIMLPIKKAMGARLTVAHSYDEFIEQGSPGIAVLFDPKSQLPPGLKLPSHHEVTESLEILKNLHEQRIKYRTKVFNDRETFNDYQ